MTDLAPGIEIDVTELRRRGPSLPFGTPKSGRYRVDFTNGECYLGQTDSIVLRLGSHGRTWDDMRTTTFWPGRNCEEGAALADARAPTVAPSGPPVRKVEANAHDVDPTLDRMRWADEHLVGREDARPAERPDQRGRTRPHFGRLSRHPGFAR